HRAGRAARTGGATGPLGAVVLWNIAAAGRAAGARGHRQHRARTARQVCATQAGKARGGARPATPGRRHSGRTSIMSQLCANGVTKRFGGITAVDTVTLTLAEGEVHGLIGPNGSGKTTLLNLLSGYYPIDGGTLLLDDTPITQASVQRRALQGIARTFQKPRLLSSLSAWQNVLLGCWKHSDACFIRTALSLPAMRRRERQARDLAYEMLCRSAERR